MTFRQVKTVKCSNNETRKYIYLATLKVHLRFKLLSQIYQYFSPFTFL